MSGEWVAAIDSGTQAGSEGGHERGGSGCESEGEGESVQCCRVNSSE